MPVVKYKPALGTDGWFWQLCLRAIRILAFFGKLLVEPLLLVVANALLHLIPPDSGLHGLASSGV
jgi:hypothetical protein